MKKIIITSFLIICLTACQKVPKEQAFETKLEDNNIIIKAKKELNNQEELPKDKKEDNSISQDINEEEKIEPKEVIIEEPKQIIEKPNISIPEEPKDTIDEESMDYQIHKGRIDCQDETSCMDKSIPIQFKFKQSISNVFYLEVISKKDNILGYFIEYNFKEFKYQNNEECHLIGNDIKNTLSDRIVSYDCTDDGILKINTDYRKE